MKIEVVETETNFCEDLEDLQHLSDLKVLFLADYHVEDINELKNFAENFNKLNLPYGLEYIFIDFRDFDYVDDEEKTEIKKIFDTLKIPFDCKVNVIFRDPYYFSYSYSHDGMPLSEEIHQQLFKSLKQNYDSNNCFKSDHIHQLVLIH